MTQTYLIALGSNRPHRRHGRPANVLAAAIRELEREGFAVTAVSPTIRSAPVGPSARRYANGALVLKTDRSPPGLLRALKRIERDFGRRAGGQRWTSRVLDLDIVLWSGGAYAEPGLVIPHPQFRKRTFVLGPAAAVAPGWRDPLSGLSIRQLHHRLTAPRPAPR